jgi:hypothetical protein
VLLMPMGAAQEKLSNWLSLENAVMSAPTSLASTSAACRR